MADGTASALVTIAEAAARGQITLRGPMDRLCAAVGIAVPQPLSATFDGGRTIVWMSPDELLVFVAPDAVASALEAFNTALAGTHHLVLDVSQSRVGFTLSGCRGAEVLAKGTPVDLSAEAFAPGTARRTRLGPLSALILRKSVEEWEVHGFRSTAGYLREWLDAAAAAGTEVLAEAL